MNRRENTDLSPTSHGEEDSDVILSPVAEIEPEPVPGLNGVPVRCTLHTSHAVVNCGDAASIIRFVRARTHGGRFH